MRRTLVLLGVGALAAWACRPSPPAAAPASASTPDAGVHPSDASPSPAAEPEAARIRPRALVVAPRFAWTECAAAISDATAALAQAGVPFDVQPVMTDWSSTLSDLSRHALVIVPGYILGSAVDAAARQRLEAFAERGGVVVLFKPTGSGDRREALRLAGLTRSERRRDLLAIRFDVKTRALAAIDAEEERVLPVSSAERAKKKEAVEIYVLTPDPAAKTESLAHAIGAGLSVAGPTVTRRPVGRGAIYAVGHDLTSFAAPRCYVNCFDPRGDVLRLLLEGTLREASSGHFAQLHTAPGQASSVLLVTHDLDTIDAFRKGPWGPPGALQALEVEKEHGVRASFNVTGEFLRSAEARETVAALAESGATVGAHGVLHPRGFAAIPRGTCAETPATYGRSPTLCGEVRVSLAMVADAAGRSPRVWRSPSLGFHPAQLEVLASSGVELDSSFGIGDLPYNLPVDAERSSAMGTGIGRRSILELPVALMDVEEDARRPGAAPAELTSANASAVVARWEDVIRKNVDNRSFTTLLVHPTRAGAGDANLRVKMDALGRLLARARTLDVTTRTLEEIAEFWRARLATKLEVEYDPKLGYVGTIATGPRTAPGLALDFGDEIREVRCESCGDVEVRGRRVVFTAPLAPRTRHAIVAVPR